MVKPVRKIVEKWMTQIYRKTQLFLNLSIFSPRQQASKILRSFTEVLGVVPGGNEQRWAIANGRRTEVVYQIHHVAWVWLANTRIRKLYEQHFG